MLRDMSAWVGTRDDGKYSIVMRQKIDMDRRWNTANKARTRRSSRISGKRIRLRVAADIHPGAGPHGRLPTARTVRSSPPSARPFVLNNRWQFFMGYRHAIFNYA